MLIPVDSSLFFTKNDPQDIRLGDLLLKKVDFAQDNAVAVVGYPDDEGIKLNGGRPGSDQAPDLIRRVLYKMTPPPENFKPFPLLEDLGNISKLNSHLDERHTLAQNQAFHVFQKNQRLVSLGGGHDYGYPDGAAFCEAFKKFSAKPLIINFDAHLDVRSNDKSNHSGTPFYRLKQKFQDQFHLIEIGLQPQCNSKSHWHWALENNIDLIPLETIENSGWESVWQNKFLQNVTKKTPVFISFDMDALCSADAGGCSQSWPTGLKLNDCLKFLKNLYVKADVRSLGVYETSPPYDHDFKTSKAAALLVHQFIFS